ncbi:MAG TPA: class I SAM-dependent methyltransferase [Candidatus Dormibacteraeota bacterium]|jgi:SAM-dependent methyltransferase
MSATSLDFAAWTARWDAQQGRYIADREGRFQVLFDALEAVAGEAPLTVVDLGCGPGSLGVRLLDRFSSARVVAVDVDPVLLALGRGAYGGRDRLTFASADLRDADWLENLGIDRADAAVSSTALHWLGTGEIRRLYRDLATLLRPGGIFLDADHARPGPGEAALAAVATRMTELHRERRGADAAPAESWQEWWDAVRTEPALAGQLAERDRLGHAHPHGRSELSDDDHRRLLREAGFQAADVVWRHGGDRVLAALR